MTTERDLPPGFKVYNVLASVVECVAARNEAEAIGQVSGALERAGFAVYEGADAFEGAEGTEVSPEFDPVRPLPPAKRPAWWQRHCWY